MFFLSKLGEKMVWQKCPQCKKMCMFFYIPSFGNYFSYAIELLLKWFYFLLVPSVDMIETKNGEDIFIVNASLGQITSVTKMPPYLVSDGLIQGYTVPALYLLLLCKLPAAGIWPIPQYSKCCTLAWMHRTVILQSGFALRVLKSEPEPKEE